MRAKKIIALESANQVQKYIKFSEPAKDTYFLKTRVKSNCMRKKSTFGSCLDITLLFEQKKCPIIFLNVQTILKMPKHKANDSKIQEFFLKSFFASLEEMRHSVNEVSGVRNH